MTYVYRHLDNQETTGNFWDRLGARPYVNNHLKTMAHNFAGHGAEESLIPQEGGRSKDRTISFKDD
jgi:hypothetical protein